MKEIRNNFSRIGFSYLAIGIIAIALQLILAMFISNINPALLSNMDFITVISAICQYAVPLPILYLLLKKIKTTDIEKRGLTLKQFLICLSVTFALMYMGNMIGIGITDLIGIVKQNPVINPIENLITNSNLWINLIIISIIAPIFEELFFRKFLIDRTLKYGAGISVFLSALMFGLFHGNLSQFFYAFFLGGFFAFVYIKTGNIIYPIVLHIAANLSGSVIGIIMQGLIDSMGSTAIGGAITLAYLGVLLILVIVGQWYIITSYGKVKKLKNNIENPFKTSLLNVGMILFIGFFIIEIAYSIMM